jgi:hypothetical protein
VVGWLGYGQNSFSLHSDIGLLLDTDIEALEPEQSSGRKFLDWIVELLLVTGRVT